MERLEELTQAWKDAKKNEAEWNAHRLSIESEIYAIVEKELPEKGTHTLATGMKVTTGFSEEWDQRALAALEWVAPVPFPFAVHYKPEGKALTYIRENLPATWAALRSALTLKPRKPSFSLPEAN